ncbi:MAG: DICT sensory domain-containing protein [Aggregatilineales bacterium]
MELNIDPNFSVWGLTQRVRTGSTLLNHRKTMNLMSYAIEDVTLIEKEPTRVFAGFQRFSRFRPQAKRYAQIAKLAQMTYVFGIPDVAPPSIPGITFVPLTSRDQLAREWFLVSSNDAFACALVTQEITSEVTRDSERMFEGILSFDVRLVEILDEWLVRTVNAQVPLITVSRPFNTKRHLQLKNRVISWIETGMDQSQLPQHLHYEVQSVVTTVA